MPRLLHKVIERLRQFFEPLRQSVLPAIDWVSVFSRELLWAGSREEQGVIGESAPDR
jgi:hypothetical protein